jgi:hypothetical protein
MITTALLVRWTNGWHDVTSAAAVAAHGRKEAALGLGASQDLNEVNTVSAQQLAIFGNSRTEIACDVFPRTDAETPFIGYSTADRITVPDVPGRPPSNERIQAIGATMDEDGRVTYAVELRDVLLDERERFAQVLTKMANGTLGGDSRVAQPVSSVRATSTPDCCPPVPGGWAISSDVLANWTPGVGSMATNSWTPDTVVHPISLTIDCDLVAGGVRFALVFSGEGPESVGSVVGTFESPGHHHVTLPYPPGTTVGTGQDIWFYGQVWLAGLVVENVVMTVAVGGSHSDIVLAWSP